MNNIKKLLLATSIIGAVSMTALPVVSNACGSGYCGYHRTYFYHPHMYYHHYGYGHGYRYGYGYRHYYGHHFYPYRYHYGYSGFRFWW